MNCRQLKLDVIDFARGVALAPSRAVAVECHLRECASCAAVVERQRAISVALRRLADQKVPALNATRLNSLMAAVGRRRGRSRPATIAVGLSVAASILIVVSLSVGVTREAPPHSSETAAALTQPGTPETGFVVLPGAAALPRLESGRVIRIEIPESELSAVGLWRAARGGAIQADVLVGQDGLARAVRLVQ
jgi:hypothetical protein